MRAVSTRKASVWYKAEESAAPFFPALENRGTPNTSFPENTW
jgi:hypothetical protein